MEDNADFSCLIAPGFFLTAVVLTIILTKISEAVAAQPSDGPSRHDPHDSPSWNPDNDDLYCLAKTEDGAKCNWYPLVEGAARCPDATGDNSISHMKQGCMPYKELTNGVCGHGNNAPNNFGVCDAIYFNDCPLVGKNTCDVKVY